MHYHHKEKEKQKATDLSPKTNNQQVQWVFQRQNSPDTKLRIGHALLTKTLPSKCKVRGFNPCVQSDNWNCAICRVIVVSVLLPMLRGSRQLESFAGQQLIACTGETFPADLTIAANHLTHLLGANFNFTTLWADGHQTFQLLPA